MRCSMQAVIYRSLCMIALPYCHNSWARRNEGIQKPCVGVGDFDPELDQRNIMAKPTYTAKLTLSDPFQSQKSDFMRKVSCSVFRQMRLSNYIKPTHDFQRRNSR